VAAPPHYLDAWIMRRHLIRARSSAFPLIQAAVRDLWVRHDSSYRCASVTGGAGTTEGGGGATADAVVVKTLPLPEAPARWMRCRMIRYSSRRSCHIFTDCWIGEGTPTKWYLRLMFVNFR
jgi:hypothetical protein